MRAAAGVRSERVYAFTCEDPEAQVRRHMVGLAVAYGAPAALARALRLARKAAFRGGIGYDPARHAALVRLARTRASRLREGQAL
ncbi:hypothetical protein [Xanthobacter oligotrophicus]|uniref:hypothetical protein n=1 Tax=Xanthobacter oligotrophicus TaxID=2607286 RepID=UPI0011F1F8E9|nr:hypothetical protein [Xanthobacter oligotrophicus]MCG5235160.1 hypothetical protein [Xanthobacter oligotrophicus]